MGEKSTHKSRVLKLVYYMWISNVLVHIYIYIYIYIDDNDQVTNMPS
jgi:hypothetical protein